MRKHLQLGLLVLALATPAMRGQAQTVVLRDNLGTHHYPVNASPEAQRYFDQGLRLFWAFNHAEAVRSFAEGERLDPACAMCAWGVALALGPNINVAMPSSAGDSARVAIARAAALATRPDEQRMIEALRARYGTGAGEARVALDTAYAVAMREVVRQAPDDAEARALLADALMNLSPWNYWKEDGRPRPATKEILRQLDEVLAMNPDHPGGCHLLIHAVEARDPRRAIHCAERLAALMPGAGHLVHMPAHIYIRVGRYADAVRTNEHALHADATTLDGPGAIKRGVYANGLHPHNHHFLAFAATMMGSSMLAIDHARHAARGLDPAVAAEIPWIEAITPITYWTLVTFGEWDRVLAEPLPPSGQRYAMGMALYARGVAFAAKRRWAEARAALDSVRRIAKVHPEGENKIALRIGALALEGEIAMRMGAHHDAVGLFTKAVALEDALPYTEPPAWYYPMRHSLGKALLKAGRFSDAERVYAEDLARFPENGWSLYGMVQALKGMRRTPEARRFLERYNRAWANADVRLAYSRF